MGPIWTQNGSESRLRRFNFLKNKYSELRATTFLLANDRVKTSRKNYTPRPMTMETRCSKVIFPNYPKKKPVKRYARTAAMGNTGKKMFVFLGLFVHAAVRGRTCAFTSKTVNTLIKNSSRDDRPSISTYNQPTAKPVRVGHGRRI